MKAAVRNASSIGLSVLINVAALGMLLLLQRHLPEFVKELQLESIFSEELAQEEITRELELDTAPSETLNVIAGGTPSSSIGSAAQPAAAPVNVQKAAVMKEVNIRPVVTDLALPSDEMIGQDLGEGEIVGEVGSMVEGYGAAMGIITQEVMRMMRQEKVTVIWLFDESGSLEDDRKEIKENYLRVYEELGIAEKQDQKLRKGNDQLLTVVASYGRDIHEHTPRPTADMDVIKSAIDKIQVDQTGDENMNRSIAAIISKYKSTARSRKLAVIVVSDESGDDGEYVEAAVTEAKAAKAPVYFLGRESTFGFPYAHQLWIDEPTKEHFWIRIRRGPETPFPECLQWNGLHHRWDVQNAGFGPYEQVRVARETGGIFFVLPGDESTLVGQDAKEKRKYDFLAMREYQPDLSSRVEYFNARRTDEFRETLFQVIARLNPDDNKLLFENHDPELNIQRELFPLEQDAFGAAAKGQILRAARAMSLNNEAIALLEKVRPLRAKEGSQRWRAGYDLAVAQLYIFRLRLYQYLLAMDRHFNDMPKANDPKANRWDFHWDRNAVIVPDEAQFTRLKQAFGMKETREEYLELVKNEETAATDRLKAILTDHPGTPWARRAETELSWGFGFRVAERIWDPTGQRAQAEKRVPKL